MTPVYRIRMLMPNEFGLIKDFSYTAIFQPDGLEPLPRSVVDTPEIAPYHENFGSEPDDIALCAESIEKNRIIGICWCRCTGRGFGHVDNKIPELALAVEQPYRKLGIGTKLLAAMLEELRSKGYHEVSLSVSKANFACELYLKSGFRVTSETIDEYIMVNSLHKSP